MSNHEVNFQSDTIVTVILEKCQKILNEILSKYKHSGRTNKKIIKFLYASLQKDMKLFNKANGSFLRILSLVNNTKALCCKELNDYNSALDWIEEATQIQKEGKGQLSVVEACRTLLNKSVILAQMSRKHPNEGKIQNKSMESSSLINNLYSHEEAISLIKQSLRKLTDSEISLFKISQSQHLPSKPLFSEIIIINYHIAANELIIFRNEKEAYSIYRKAYALAIKVLGMKNSLTQLLKDIISETKAPEAEIQQQKDLRMLLMEKGIPLLSISKFENEKGRESPKKQVIKRKRIKTIECSEKNYIQINKSFSLTKLKDTSRLPGIHKEAGSLITEGKKLSRTLPEYHLKSSQNLKLEDGQSKYIESSIFKYSVPNRGSSKRWASTKKKSLVVVNKEETEQKKQSDCQLI